MTRILVVYYSRSGNTQMIARQLARACKADLEPIVDVSPRDQITSYVRSAYEAALHKPATVQNTQHDPSRDDLVSMGTPVWLWNMASPVRTYLLRHRRQSPRVAYFCTYGASGQEKVLGGMVKDITTTRHRDALTRFAQGLKSGDRPSMQRANEPLISP
jgi:flavodoxin